MKERERNERECQREMEELEAKVIRVEGGVGGN